ncbi:UvrD-helicase domain-containing protein [Niabella beijingensis]|uniref:UvrD-helicase domain-containing protein n=1 Tax=Niabella beijingensis TaxID=2872700 RepID=UPI001CBD8218|nr:ATP-dependent helicase [Niabella beijingensis]MBZ4191708.1 ATP-dependent helicase [Niabella beijingensis]
MFYWDKGDLNQEQEDAILHPESVLLIACPGSGKTRTLTYKIAYELSRLKSIKEYVIAITYTNNAADEIKERVELLGVDTSQLWIGTIHSFCSEWILRPYYLYHNRLKDGFRIINSHESEKILTTLCRPYQDQRITFWDCGILAKPDNLYLTCLDTNKHEALQEIYSEYFKILEENHQIDFEQILFYSYQILLEKPIIADVLCKLFPFILIDEYQDTKEIQYHIISKILVANKGCSKTLIVGDPNQSIYQSLGGYPMPKADLETLLGFELKELGLTQNYRSSEKIITYFEYYKTYANTIVASGKTKDYDSIISYNSVVSVNDLIEEIARLLLFNINEKGISPNEICIAAPQWVHIASITRRLMVRLPDYSFDGPGMAPFSRDIDNFWFKVSRIVLTEPSPFMYVRRLRWSREVLHDLGAAGIDVSDLTSKSFLSICNGIDFDEKDGLNYLRLFFAELCRQLTINLEHFSTLQEHYDSFFESSQARIQRLIHEGNPYIGDIENFRKVFKQKDGITVSTLHGIKGEEYDTMIGFALLNDLVPHFNDPNGNENSKKLLYVLASRAKKHLHIISETGRRITRFNPSGLLPTPHLRSYSYQYDNF